MNIIELRAENFKRLSVVNVTPQGNMVEITGANGEGKTSVLDSIWAALGGKDAAPEKPIRSGKKTARIEIKIGDADGVRYVVERSFTDKDSYLKVTDAAGSKHASPQKILDGLMGTIGFDPLAFMRMGPAEQFKMLRGIVKLDVDLDAMDRRRATAFEERTGINRDAKSARTRADAIVVPDLPDEKPDIADITGRLTGVVAHNQRRDEVLRRHEIAREAAESAKESLQKARQAVIDGEAIFETRLELLERALREVAPEARDPETIRAELDAANATTEGFRRQQDKIDAEAEAATQERRAEDLTAEIDKIDADKKAALERAKMPVEGLGFEGGVVTFKTMPLAQASAAEQLRVSAAIGAALNPELRVVLARDGSLLDSKSMALLAQFAEENDLQVWIERVDESGEVGVVMVDGHVKGQEAEVEAFEAAENAPPAAGAKPGATAPQIDPERQKRATDFLGTQLVALKASDLPIADRLNAETKAKLKNFPELLSETWAPAYLAHVKTLRKGK